MEPYEELMERYARQHESCSAVVAKEIVILEKKVASLTARADGYAAKYFKLKKLINSIAPWAPNTYKTSRFYTDWTPFNTLPMTNESRTTTPAEPARAMWRCQDVSPKDRS